MATELAAKDFAEAIGVKVEALSALERSGLPFVATKKSGHLYPLPKALTWYVEYQVAARVGGIPPRTYQKEFAALVGYTPRQISNLVDDKVITTIVESGKRTYPLPDAVLEVMKYREAQAKGKSGEKETEYDAAKTQKMKADAQTAELNLMRQRGELIDRGLVARAIGELLAALKAQLVQFPARYEADLVGLESRVRVRGVLKPAINQEIQRLSAAAAQVGRRIQMIEASDDDEAGDEEGESAGDAS